MSLLEELKGLGVNVNEGLDRVMGDDSLYEMMLGLFVDAVESNSISLDEFSGSDLDGLTRKVHTLKGTTGNLSLTPLFSGYMKTLELLRGGRPAEAKEEFERMLPVQEKIVGCIKGSMG